VYVRAYEFATRLGTFPVPETSDKTGFIVNRVCGAVSLLDVPSAAYEEGVGFYRKIRTKRHMKLVPAGYPNGAVLRVLLDFVRAWITDVTYITHVITTEFQGASNFASGRPAEAMFVPGGMGRKDDGQRCFLTIIRSGGIRSRLDLTSVRRNGYFRDQRHGFVSYLFSST